MIKEQDYKISEFNEKLIIVPDKSLHCSRGLERKSPKQLLIKENKKPIST